MPSIPETNQLESTVLCANVQMLYIYSDSVRAVICESWHFTRMQKARIFNLIVLGDISDFLVSVER
jgi:hypothetical protein